MHHCPWTATSVTLPSVKRRRVRPSSTNGFVWPEHEAVGFTQLLHRAVGFTQLQAAALDASEPMYHAVQLASMSLLGPSFILDELPSINLFSHAVWEKFELSLMELRVVAVWGGALASSDRLLGWGGALASSDRLLGCGVRERGEGTM